MGEINLPQQLAKGFGVQRIKKSSTKVDLTPMVDLGFLLITFFMVSTAWTKPRVQPINLPADGSSTVLGKSAALTLIALEQNKVWYYSGDINSAIQEKQFGIVSINYGDEIGNLIRRKQVALDRNPLIKRGRDELTILIKPTKESTLQNLVSLFDEMKINSVDTYMLTEPDSSELRMARQHKN